MMKPYEDTVWLREGFEQNGTKEGTGRKEEKLPNIYFVSWLGLGQGWGDVFPKVVNGGAGRLGENLNIIFQICFFFMLVVC